MTTRTPRAGALAATFAAFALVNAPLVAQASVPHVMTYQGVVRDTATGPLNGTMEMVFSIHDALSDGAMLWSETQDAVTVADGLFTVYLGAVDPLPPSVFDQPSRYLEIEMDGTLLSPRRELATAPFAFRAAVADSVAGGGSGGDDGDWVVSGDVVYRTGGRVGVGTSSPAEELHVVSDGGVNATMILEQPGGTTLEISAQNGIGSIGTENAKPFRVNTNNAVRLTIDETGNVGVGTHVPAEKLHVNGKLRANQLQVTSGASSGHVLVSDGAGNATWQAPIAGDDGDWAVSGADVYRSSGRVGIGTTSPADALDVRGAATFTSTGEGTPVSAVNTAQSGGAGFFQLTSSSNTSACVTASNFGNGKSVGAWSFGTGPAGYFEVNNAASSSAAVHAKVTNGVGFAVLAEGGVSSDYVQTGELEITAGADVSERFDIRAGVGDDDTPERGMVVRIDPDHPCELRVADTPYDRRVVGVVSGAGGVKPGLLLGQAGSAATGDHPVALTGRVYCFADAGFGSISPGDLLTTSATRGHAMKVRDTARAQGAVLGKAMTGLDGGRGLVLVLVTLQ